MQPKKRVLLGFNGPEPFFGVPDTYFNLWEKEMGHRNSVPEINHIREFIAITNKRSREIITRNKYELKVLNDILNGNCFLWVQVTQNIDFSTQKIK